MQNTLWLSVPLCEKTVFNSCTFFVGQSSKCIKDTLRLLGTRKKFLKIRFKMMTRIYWPTSELHRVVWGCAQGALVHFQTLWSCTLCRHSGQPNTRISNWISNPEIILPKLVFSGWPSSFKSPPAGQADWLQTSLMQARELMEGNDSTVGRGLVSFSSLRLTNQVEKCFAEWETFPLLKDLEKCVQHFAPNPKESFAPLKCCLPTYLFSIIGIFCNTFYETCLYSTL